MEQLARGESKNVANCKINICFTINNCLKYCNMLHQLRFDLDKVVKNNIVLMLVFASGADVAVGQPVAVSSEIANVEAAPGQIILRSGTQVQLRLLETLTTKNKVLRDGQRVRLEVAETVFVDGVKVVPVGTPAVAEVIDVRNKGMWGKSGRFLLRILYMTVNGRQIRITGGTDDKGVAGGVGAVAVSALVFLPAGFFMTGTSANLPSGTAMKAFVEEDVSFNVGVARPAFVPAGSGDSLGAAAIAAGLSAPVVAVPDVGPQKLKAATPSGYCLDVPKGYAGIGTPQRPIISTYAPACWQVLQ